MTAAEALGSTEHQSVEQVSAARPMRRRDGVRAVRDLLRHQLLQQDKTAPEYIELAPEHELAHEYSTGRNVIRLALAALQREGLIKRVPGSGTFVRKRKIRIRHLRLEGLALGLVHNGTKVRYERHLVEFRPAPEPVAVALGIPVGSRIAVIERKSYYGDKPCSLNSRYLPAEVAEKLLEKNSEVTTIDWFSAMEEAAGVLIAGARTITEAIVADELLAPDLGVPIGAPVILMHRTIYAVDGRVVEFNLTRSRGDLVEIESWQDR